MEFTLTAHARQRLLSRKIDPAWIGSVLASPQRFAEDPVDPLLTHAFGEIEEQGRRVLHVVYDHSRLVPHVVTAYFDRNLKGRL